jgi:hypothetical protein
MSFVVAAVMILALAVAIAYPFWSTTPDAPAADASDAREVLRREKDVALLAIREAELDRAMGKLSDEDYGTLRGQYERRALDALGALDKVDGNAAGVTTKTETPLLARFCSACGRRHRNDDRFCAGCGHARA